MIDYERDYTTEYARAVVSGEILASRKNIQSCQRHLDDLSNPLLNYHFDYERANNVIDFFGELPDPKSRKLLTLAGYQTFIVGSLMGWRDSEDNRRYTKAYVSMARKNGKTLTIAGLALYDLLYGDEPRAERLIGLTANNRDQASIAYKMVKSQLEAVNSRSQYTKKNTKITDSRKIINNLIDGSEIRATSSDAGSQEGEQYSLGIIDEYHIAKSNDMLQSISRGQVLLKSPLLIIISTAGEDLNVPMYEEYQYITRLLNREVKNDNYFVYCAEQDSEDEIHDPSTWIKSNPLLEVESIAEVLRENINDDVQEGIDKNDLNSILVKNMNLWRQSSKDTYIQMNDWQAGYMEDELDIKGKDVYIGVDLSRSEDLTALTFIYPLEDKKYYVDAHVFVGFKNSIQEKAKRDKIDYEKLVRTDKASLTHAESGIIDPEQVVNWLIDFIDDNELNVKAICYDPWESSYFVTKMEKETGHPLIQVAQDYKSLGPVLKQFRLDVFEKRVVHNNNPNLNLAIGNAITKTDNNNMMILDKKINRQKIDALVSLVTGYSQAINYEFESDLQDYIMSDDFGF
ncbi:MAG: phage terminase family protein [Staphylococcus equorum]|uniref:terminase large subunit n=1 Tax=Staphylococcus TaxID=1279 RepID=UPI002552EDF0|nr:terminase TerL endonuclease subunit [Staphylococcus equorum]MDK9870480.1 terminase large subunit [Staphylococcus equorum]MDK9878290.1 terminase large subunit [Staphylococcus equorum]MDN6570970.1 phage terminase family protein [Staphylococcus equorum]MDN6610537.1 phage terminase family protein [Staphylococcus equorum]MDN6750716.1 phage terminase family protein [Staphylococcus equorum]